MSITTIIIDITTLHNLDQLPIKYIFLCVKKLCELVKTGLLKNL